MIVFFCEMLLSIQNIHQQKNLPGIIRPAIHEHGQLREITQEDSISAQKRRTTIHFVCTRQTINAVTTVENALRHFHTHARKRTQVKGYIWGTRYKLHVLNIWSQIDYWCYVSDQLSSCASTLVEVFK